MVHWTIVCEPIFLPICAWKVKLFAQYYVNKLYEENHANLVTVNHLIEIIPYLGLLVVGAMMFGEVGVAAVVLLREIFDALLSRFRLAKVRRISAMSYLP